MSPYKLGAVTQEVTVSAGAELVASREAAVGQLIDQRRVVELPLNGRHAQDLVFLSAGTADLTSRYCGFNCFGGVYPGEQRANINGNSAGGVSLHARRQRAQRLVPEHESAVPESGRRRRVQAAGEQP